MAVLDIHNKKVGKRQSWRHECWCLINHRSGTSAHAEPGIARALSASPRLSQYPPPCCFNIMGKKALSYLIHIINSNCESCHVFRLMPRSGATKQAKSASDRVNQTDSLSALTRHGNFPHSDQSAARKLRPTNQRREIVVSGLSEHLL